MLIKKVLVYSSKIESIKKKIIRQNPKFTAISMFEEFSIDKQRLSLEGLYQLFQAFGFHPPSISIYKIMIFLSNYVLESTQSQIPDSGITQDTLNSSLGLPKEYTVTPEGRLASIRKMNSEMNHMRGDQVYRPMTQSIGQHSHPTQRNENKTISLGEFRKLFESGSELSSSSMNSRNHTGELRMKEIDYHLIRQIFMLVARMLDDFSKIIRTIQPYGSLEIFSYLLEFNVNSKAPDHNSRANPKNIGPQDSIDNAIILSKLKEEGIKQENPSFKMPMDNFGKDKKDFNFTKKKQKQNDFDIEEADDEDSGDGKFEMINDNKRGINQSPVINKSIDKANDLKTVGIDTLRELLEFHNIQFISDDLPLVLQTLGSLHGRVSLAQFDRFLASPLWNL
jgi:hypothetical protein